MKITKYRKKQNLDTFSLKFINHMFLITFFLFLFSINLQANNKINFKHMTIENGLPHNSTMSIIQDRQGFIWIATRYGLSKFDGIDYTNYASIKDDSNSLTDNFLWNIIEDDAGKLWIASWGGGLNKYDPLTDKFTRYRHDKNDPTSLSDDYLWSSYQDNRGTLWICTNNGLNRLGAVRVIPKIIKINIKGMLFLFN